MRIFIGDGIIDGKPSLISISAKSKGKPPTKGKPSKKSKSKPDSDPDLSDDIAGELDDAEQEPSPAEAKLDRVKSKAKPASDRHSFEASPTSGVAGSKTKPFLTELPVSVVSPISNPLPMFDVTLVDLDGVKAAAALVLIPPSAVDSSQWVVISRTDLPSFVKSLGRASHNPTRSPNKLLLGGKPYRMLSDSRGNVVIVDEHSAVVLKLTRASAERVLARFTPPSVH